MSEIVILYILCRYDATIYKISKIMEEMFFAFLKPSLGTINPAIKRLHNVGCIEIEDKMSDGGMASKLCSITPFGRKHLSNLLLSLELNNPAHILNYSKIALFCSDVLDEAQKKEFLNNLKNYLIVYKGRTQEALNNPYADFNEVQKNAVRANIDEAQKILELL